MADWRRVVGTPHAYATHFSAGETIKVAGEHELKLVFWLARDSAERG